MDQEEALFNQIADRLMQEYEPVNRGKMMSSPGIRLANKVFAFYHKKEMVFKLGKGFDPTSQGIENYSLLNPFKSKPPMAAWFQVPASEQDKWEDLARQAMRLMSESRS